jgi:TIR domain
MFLGLFYLIVFLVAAAVSAGIVREVTGSGGLSGLGVPIGAFVAFCMYQMQMRRRKARAVELERDQPARPRGRAPDPSKPADVFISYKREERADVGAIAHRLTELKVRVWFDAEMRSGTAFDAEINRQVRMAKAVLVCWSPGAVESDWVRAEAAVGRERGVLAAVMVKVCELPTPFNLIHADDLRAGVGPANQEWLNLLERLGALLGRPGLAAFEALDERPERADLAAWIAAHPSDPLREAAGARLRALRE